MMLGALPLFLVTHFFSLRFVKKRAIRLANFEALKRMTGGVKIYTNWTLLIIRLCIVIFLILAMAGMVFWYEGTSTSTAYVLAIDASGSMLATDFNPNRLEAAKQAALEFIDSLGDSGTVGIVSFSGIAQIEQPLEDSSFAAKEAIKSITFKSIHGTAIGDALKVALQLVAHEDRPKAIILLTDGQENIVSAEEIRKVIELAQKQHVIIHTIAIGTPQGGVVPGLELISTVDTKLLEEIAQTTGGTYLLVDTQESLVAGYASLISTTQTQIPVSLRLPFLFIGLLLLFVEWGLITTKYKSVP